jgi:hypothetical protein
MRRNRHTVILIGLTALALLLRMSMVVYHQSLGWELRYDPTMYLTLAENMRHGVYSMFHPTDIPDTIKRPGYPFLIHLLGDSVLLTLLFQSMLSALKVPLVFLLGRSVGLAPRFALLAAGLMVIEPVDVLLSAQLLTEALFGFLLLAGTVLLFRGKQWYAWVAAAVLFAAAAWVRPNGAALAVITGVGACSLLKKDVARSTMFIALVLLSLLPWALHNQRVLGRFYLGDSGVVAAGYYQVPDVLRAVGDERAPRWHPALNDRAASMNWEDDAAYHAFFDDLRAEVLATFLAHPITWVRVQAVKAARITVALGRGHIALFFPKGSVVARLLMAISFGFSALLVFAIVVPVLCWRQVPHAVWLLLLMAISLIAMGALTTSDARFKNPGMAALIVVAAWGLKLLVGRKRSVEH